MSSGRSVAASQPPVRAGDAAANLKSRQDQASQNTRSEYDALLLAMQALEAALASPAPARERSWAQRARNELADVRTALEAHVLSAEAPEGLLHELLLAAPGAAARIDELRGEHSHLILSARGLEEGLANQADGDVNALRREAARLLTAMHQHHAAEVDLIFECFWTDIGVGD